jgi:hypothetical protein
MCGMRKVECEMGEDWKLWGEEAVAAGFAGGWEVGGLRGVLEGGWGV